MTHEPELDPTPAMIEAVLDGTSTWDLAKATSCPETLAVLARNSDASVRGHVARNPSTPSDALAVLAGDPTELIRFQVAQHAATPSVALERLATDPDRGVRYAVSTNPETPPECLAVLEANGDANTPHDMLYGLIVGHIADEPMPPINFGPDVRRYQPTHMRN